MAKRGPGRPKSAPLGNDTVSILNGEVPPGSSLMPSPKKRKRETGDESPTAKRRAANQSAQADPEVRRSTRLSHPRVTTRQQRAAGDSGQMQSREIYEVPPADPSHSSRTTGARKRLAKAKAGGDEDDNASPVEDGEEGALNPLMTSPSAKMRNYARRGGMFRQGEDPEDRVVDVQPVNKGQRHQRVLTNGLTTRRNVLLKPQSVSSGAMEQSSAPQHALEEQAAAVAVTSAHEEVIRGTQASTNEVPQDQQDRTSAPEESVDTVETQSIDGQQHETSHVASTGEGLEEAFRLYDCEKSWDTMRNAARENLNNDDRDNQALEIRELVSLIKKARAVYRAIRNGDDGGIDDQESKIGEHLVDIKKRVRTIRPTQDTKKDSRLVKDVYVQGIPKMVMLLKMVLVTRALHGELSISSLKELVTIIDATLSLCDKACRWQPRPTLEYGVKRRTRTEILPSLEALRTAYMEAQFEGLDDEDKEAEAAEEAQKAAKRQALADHVAKFLAEEEEKRKCVEHNNHAVTPDRHQRSINRANSAADVFEIDDLNLDDTAPTTAPNGTGRSLPWRETGVAAARQALPSVLSQTCATGDVARRSRERTEDIPGPMVPDWSRREDGQLLYGLELFRGANRYLEIDRHFGSAGGPLSGRDVDELMQRAKFLKHSLASHIEEEREQVGKVDHWAFLLSVEG
jgi:hypothetical protein